MGSGCVGRGGNGLHAGALNETGNYRHEALEVGVGLVDSFMQGSDGGCVVFQGVLQRLEAPGNGNGDAFADDCIERFGLRMRLGQACFRCFQLRPDGG